MASESDDALSSVNSEGVDWATRGIGKRVSEDAPPAPLRVRRESGYRIDKQGAAAGIIEHELKQSC